MELTATQVVTPGRAKRKGGALLWQRTDTVGTELVFPEGAVARGSAVVAGSLAYATRWHADLDADRAVRALTVTCDGAGWSRTLTIARPAAEEGAAADWACHVVVSGESHLADGGTRDDAGLAGAELLLLADSPIFLTWAARNLTPEDGPVTRAALRVLVPSLEVVRADVTFHRINEQRLRVTGTGNAVTYEVDPTGVITYQPGRLRIAV